MIVVYTFAVLLIILPYESKGKVIQCVHREQPVCGNDGITYSSMCELEILRSVRTNLTVVHQGSCNYLIKTLIRILQMQESRKAIESLRGRHRTREYDDDEDDDGPRMKWRLFKLAQMINTQRNIGGFEFKHNNINTQGTNNGFSIDIS